MVAERTAAAGTIPPSLGVSKAPVGLRAGGTTQSLAPSLAVAEAGQDLRLCAKDVHEKRDNPCPGEVVILTSSVFAQGQFSFFF